MSGGPSFEVLSLFPEAVADFLRAGLVGKAIERGLVEVHCTNIRDYSEDRHRTVDDAPFGGGPGMVMKIEPVVRALEDIEQLRGPTHRILLTPTGQRFDQRVAAALARKPRIALLCGRYEGIDDRVREHFVHQALSLGDFVLNGGEVAALAVIEAVSRLCEGVLGNPDSLADESFHRLAKTTWLEYPQYTRPAEFRGLRVPDVLLSGDHAAIARWREDQAEDRSQATRPEGPAIPMPAPGLPIYVALNEPRDPTGFDLLSRVIRHHRLAGLILVGGEGEGDLAARGWAEAAGGLVGMTMLRDQTAMVRRLNRAHGGRPRVLALSLPEVEGPACEALDWSLDPAQTAPAWVLAFDSGNEPSALPQGATEMVQIALERRTCDLRSVLALPDAMIDSSQPWLARVAVVLDRIMGVFRHPSTRS